MTKSIIYYTDSKLDDKIALPVRDILLSIGLPIVSVSLKPLNFGENIVLDLKPGVITMFKQILTALEASKADNVFFAEHDVLYHKTHFEFTPNRNDTFYYNTNIWQWKYSKDFAITYDNIRSLSNLCVNRQLAIKHYKKRLQLIKNKEWEDDSKQPYWVRRLGYEPGTKSSRQEMISKDKSECWQSKYSNIDIRHKNTLTPPKMDLSNFKHKPQGWVEVYEIPGWGKAKNLIENF